MTESMLETPLGRGSPLLFLHANAYAPGAYRQLLQPIAEHYTVHPLKLRPLWDAQPINNWHALVDDITATLDTQFDQPVVGVGHSLGAVTLLLAAAQRANRFSSIVLIEPGAPPAWLAFWLRRAPRWFHEGNPYRQAALRRRDRWPSREAAFADERQRRLHARVSDEVLSDIVEAGLIDHPEGGKTLRFSKHWEASLYESPVNVWRVLRSSLPPVTLLRGAESKVLSRETYRRWQAVHPSTRGIEIPDSGHLLPLEQPEVTARIVLDALRILR